MRHNNSFNSKIDRLMLSSFNRKELAAFQSKVKRLCARLGLDVDLIVRDSMHAKQMKNFPGNIINSALQTGVYI